MYPFLRFANVVRLARKKTKQHFMQPSSIEFRCHPWDLDMFNEMNNGRVLTLYDLGRMDVAVRCGLIPVLKNNKWALVVAGSSVRYRKRVHMFDKITMCTRCVGVDRRWMYLEQSMWIKGEPCSSVLIRAGVSSKKGLVDPETVLSALEQQPDTDQLPLWVKEWIDSEEHRPWPPTDSEKSEAISNTYSAT